MNNLTDDTIKRIYRTVVAVGASNSFEGGTLGISTNCLKELEKALEELMERRKKDKENGPG